MKRTQLMMTIGILCLLMAAPTFAAGGFGNGGFGNRGGGGQGPAFGTGPGDGTGPIAPVLEGEEFTVAGTISAFGGRGQGVEIDTGDEIVTVYGIGPIRFWENLGIDPPDVGDGVSVTVIAATFSDGSIKNIATGIDIGGQTIELRDAETGLPLWRKPGGNGPGGGYPCDAVSEEAASL